MGLMDRIKPKPSQALKMLRAEYNKLMDAKQFEDARVFTNQVFDRFIESAEQKEKE